MKQAYRKIVSMALAVLLAAGVLSSGAPLSLAALAAGSKDTPARWLEAAAAETLAEQARQSGLGYIRLDSGAYDGIRAEAAKALAGLRLEYDTLSGKAVRTRLYIAKPELLAADMPLAGETKSPEAEKVYNHFHRFFSNKLWTMHFAAQGDFGQPVRVAMRADLDGVTTDKLSLCLYDSAANSYTRVAEPAFGLDGSGKYLMFTVARGGAVVVSEGALSRRAVPLPLYTPSTTTSNSGSGRDSGGSSGGGNTTPATVPVTGVTLSRSALALGMSDADNTAQLTATVSPADATDKAVAWESSDEAVATVDQTGLVTANALGTAVITVTTRDGGYTAICTVTVADSPPAHVPVTGVTLGQSGPLALPAGGTAQLTATISPADATDQTVTWSTDAPAVATVDQTGLVTAIAVGRANITVTTNDGGCTAVCAVAVQTPVSTRAELDAVRNNPAGDYILTADINVGSDWLPIGGNGSNPFAGTFNGNGHTITIGGISSALPIRLWYEIGVFGDIEGGKIENLTVAGSIAYDSSISKCVGGIAGSLARGTIENCVSHVAVTITGTGTGTNLDNFIGGIVGDLKADADVQNCYATGAISVDVGGAVNYAGGIAGYVQGNSSGLSNCVALNSQIYLLISRVSFSNRLAGSCDTGITNCHASTAMIGNWNPGGSHGAQAYGSDCAAVPTADWWKSAMSDWDWNDVWEVQDGSLPTLR